MSQPDGLRSLARAAIGVTGEDESPPLREAVARSGVGWYPLIALSLLVIVDQFQEYGFVVLGPEISHTLGISKGGLAALAAVRLLAITLATLPMAAWVQRRARRGLLAVGTAFAWSIVTLFTGFVIRAVSLLGVLVADGASSGSVAAVHPSLLVDLYPPDVRVRGLAVYRAADATGNMVSPLLVALLTGVFALTWRGVFIVMGGLCIIAAVASARLRDPGLGRWDASRIRDLVRRESGLADAPAEESAGVSLGFFEIVHRLLLIPTMRRVLAANAVLGMFLVPLFTFLFFFLQERWGMGPSARGLFFAVMPIFSFGALALIGRRGDAMFKSDPAKVLRLGSVCLAGGVVTLALAVAAPVFGLMALCFGVALALFAVLGPILNITLLSIVPAEMRPHASALAGIFLAAVGGLGGLLLLGGIERRFGTGGAIASLAIPGVIAALVLRTAAHTVNDDLDAMLIEAVEQEELRLMSARGQQAPLLACRHIDFSYGPVQALFDVSFAVEEGEMVALLGTNGAGKSTLLSVISGLGLPSRGSVRLRGMNITWVDAERRLRLGITQIDGGRAVFGPLSVVDNLRVFGYSHGRNRRAVEAGIDAGLDTFPALAERRNQMAATLSGGEQQMLGLTKAFTVKPQLLLIDELSLGLSPKVVSQLLQMVRLINEQGTSVVLVEQSVNIALELVEHAYFMEKGEIRFDGPARELLTRDDLLRAVFLEGAASVSRPRTNE